MLKSQHSPSSFRALLAVALMALLVLSACTGGSSSDGETSDDGTNNEEPGDDTNMPNGNDDSDNDSTETPIAINISTDLSPSDGDTGMKYELLGYRMHSGRILAMDVLATNTSSVVKSRGRCNADVSNGDDFVAFAFSNFLYGSPLRPGDEMVATVFFPDVSDPTQVDTAVADCNFTDLVTNGNNPAITYDFVEFTGPDNLGRIVVNIQINNNSGETIKSAYCDFSARDGNRILDSSRSEFNFGRDVLPGEAYVGEGYLILDFDEFESDTVDPADMHCDYQLA